jgi:alkaline phosphatase
VFIFTNSKNRSFDFLEYKIFALVVKYFFQKERSLTLALQFNWITMRIAIIFCSFSVFLFCACTNKNNHGMNQPKNIILLISDGTGLSQISAAFYYKDTPVNYQRFQNIGLIKTSSSRQKITDSGAGATAFASGVKTYNGAIGVADDSTSVRNLVEVASRNNLKTGVIATSSITHATPACFYAHVYHRNMAEEIATQLPISELDFFAAGGLQFFNQRSDGKNLMNQFKQNNFALDTIALEDYQSIQDHEKQGYLLAKDGMKKIIEGRENFLPKATELAIQFLNKGNTGFFAMVEGSQIDWAGHNNNAKYLISEMIDFDETIGKALDFAEKDGETLVIVTSDHETGGFTLASKKTKGNQGMSYNNYNEIEPSFSTNGHSAALIPVFAYGPGSETFAGVYENTEIFHKILEVSEWK